MAAKKRYWVYSHDPDGQIDYDFGEHAHLKDAIDLVAHELVKLYPYYGGVTYRVVDNFLQGGTTVWIAGSGNNIVVPEGITSEMLNADLESLVDEMSQRDPVDVYGTPEHEAWLVEMERQEG